MHRALQQDPSMGERQPDCGGLGVRAQAGPGQGRRQACPAAVGQPKAGGRQTPPWLPWVFLNRAQK